MNWESVQLIVRRDLEATAPSDEEILARFSRRKARMASKRAAPRGWQYAFGAFAVCSLAGALFWISSARSPFSAGVRVTQEVWPNASGQAREAQRDPADMAHQQEAIPSTALREEVKVTPAEAPRARAPSKAPRAKETTELRGAPRWESVAQAMREGDEARAEQLIGQLLESPDAETRDNARLAHVQMSVQVREGVRSLPAHQMVTLRELRTAGATSSIRASARRLLAQLEGAAAVPEEGLPSPEAAPSSAH